MSCVVIIQESNLCIHTWPEFGYAAADFFTCGETVNPWKSFEYLKGYLKAQRFNCMELQRGSTQLINDPSLVSSNVHTGILHSGGANQETEYSNEAISVKVPKDHVAITAIELNEDLNQHVITIAKPIVSI